MELRQRGYKSEQLPSLSTMAVVLNRMGYRLRPVMKAKPQKKYQPQKLFLPTLNAKVALERQESKDSA
jgi:hypothetical protein